MKVAEGQKVQLECHVTGSPEPELSWYLDGVVLSLSTELRIVRQDSWCHLMINEVLAEDEGQYTVIASNIHGTASSSALLTVISKSSSPVKSISQLRFDYDTTTTKN